MPDPPADRGDLGAMGYWVADCLDQRDLLVFRTVVRHLAEQVERQAAVLDALNVEDLREAAGCVVFCADSKSDEGYPGRAMQLDKLASHLSAAADALAALREAQQ
jgi:hypothetical protein